MPPFLCLFRRRPFFTLLILLLGLMGCSANESRRPSSGPSSGTPLSKPLVMPQIRLDEVPPPPNSNNLYVPTFPSAKPDTFSNALPSITLNAPRPRETGQVLLGIDVLEQQGFDVLKGKRVGLLTHPAGVNRRGESTIDVLRRAPGLKLVALYAVEHGLYGELPAEKIYPDKIDPRTGIMVYSLYNGKSRWASPSQLAGIDVLVIDLQDIGSRSYTYVSAMRYALESCFKAGKEVVVLDRPNPLGGLKVDGPLLEQQWTSYVGAFRVPYVHGLTIGELAKMSKEAPGILDIPEKFREKGRLTVIPMKGWKRSMRWPDTGLKWIATSPMIQDYSAVMGYAMTGLGCYLGGFRHGVGDQHAFRGIYHKAVPSDFVEKELNAFHIPGLRFQKISVPGRDGKAATGIYIEINDWDDWRPTELSFYLMKLACKYEKQNPFVTTPQGQVNGFLRHMGNTAFYEALKREGARIDVDLYIRDWQTRCKAYQTASRKYWLYY